MWLFSAPARKGARHSRHRRRPRFLIRYGGRAALAAVRKQDYFLHSISFQIHYLAQPRSRWPCCPKEAQGTAVAHRTMTTWSLIRPQMALPHLLAGDHDRAIVSCAFQYTANGFASPVQHNYCHCFFNFKIRPHGPCDNAIAGRVRSTYLCYEASGLLPCDKPGQRTQWVFAPAVSRARN